MSLLRCNITVVKSLVSPDRNFITQVQEGREIRSPINKSTLSFQLTMKPFLFATLLLVVFLQNEVSAKSHEAAKRATTAEEEGHQDPKKVDVDLKNVNIDHDELAELEHDDTEEEDEQSDAPKNSPRWSRRRRRRRRRKVCMHMYRRRFRCCKSFHSCLRIFHG